MADNHFTPRVEHQLTKHAQEKYLEELYARKQYSELLKAAKLLNDLHFVERMKTDWAVREASNNLAALCGYDRDSC